MAAGTTPRTASNASPLARVTSSVEPWPRFLRDRRNLSGRLAEAEDDFREALPYRAVVIDFREPEILERTGSKCVDEVFERLAGFDVTARDAIEQFLQQFV